MKISRKLFSDGAKKALACGLSAAMVVAFAPTVAFGAPAADAATATWTSSTGNGTQTGTLTEVINKVNSLTGVTSVTITLNKDVTVGSDTNTCEQGAGYDGFTTNGTFAVNKAVTFNGNGKTISAYVKSGNNDQNSSYNPILRLASGSSISGLTVVSPVGGEGSAQVVITGAARLQSNGVAADETTNTAAAAGTITVGAVSYTPDDESTRDVNETAYTVTGAAADVVDITTATIPTKVSADAKLVKGTAKTTVVNGTITEVSAVNEIAGGTVGAVTDVATISGGTVSTISVDVDKKTVVKGTAVVKASGGKVYKVNSATGETKTFDYDNVVNTGTGALEIAGGTINGVVTGATISGGVFAYDPDSYKYLTYDQADSLVYASTTEQVNGAKDSVNNTLANNAAEKKQDDDTYVIVNAIDADGSNDIDGATNDQKAAIQALTETAFAEIAASTITSTTTNGQTVVTGTSSITGLNITGANDAAKVEAIAALKDATKIGAADKATAKVTQVDSGFNTTDAAFKNLVKAQKIQGAAVDESVAGQMKVSAAITAMVKDGDSNKQVAYDVTAALPVEVSKDFVAGVVYGVFKYTAEVKNNNVVTTPASLTAVEDAVVTYGKAATNGANAQQAVPTKITWNAEPGAQYVVLTTTQAAIDAVVNAEALAKIAEALGIENPEEATLEEILKAAEGVSEGTDAIKEILGEAYDEEKTLAENIAAVAEAAKTEQEATDVAAIKAAIEAAGLTYDESKSVAENVEAAIAAAIKNQADVDAEALKKALENAATEADKAQQEAVENAVKAAEEKAATEQEKAVAEAVAEAKATAATAAANVKAAASKQLAKVKNKTVKAKAKKATGKTAKKKAVKLASTTGVTYAKAYTSYKKVTISKKGKVTVKKGAKKGTYKMVVVATCGDYAKTVTVTVKVK